MAHTNLPDICGKEEDWYPLRREHSVPHHLAEIQTTPLQGHPALTSALEQILVVTMPRVAKIFKSVIDELIYGTEF